MSKRDCDAVSAAQRSELASERTPAGRVSRPAVSECMSVSEKS
jgi:hypothetical protein